MTLKELKSKVATIVKVKPSELHDESGPDSIAAWDSMAELAIIAMLDEELDGEISPEEAQQFRSFRAVADFARERGILA